MKVFLDTSVLVPVFLKWHQHHPSSLFLFSIQQRDTSYTSAHCLAEVYSTLTGIPGAGRASVETMSEILTDIRARLSIVTLDESDYLSAMGDAAELNVFGGGIYDALVARCALKAQVETLYTWNVKHFVRLGPDVAALVRTP